MSNAPKTELDAWEGEGGAPEQPDHAGASLRGTENQVEWATRIKRQVNEEFDRVAAAFRVVAHRYKGRRRTETETIIAILEEKRLEVMKNKEAGYFIHGWQEIGDQVRQLIFHDPRYQAIKTSRPSRLTVSSSLTARGGWHLMSIRPLHDRIVVKRVEEQESTPNGIVIPDSAREKPQEGEVIAVGHGKMLKNGRLMPLDVKVGDLVLFGKYSGAETKLAGTEYVIMREDDVLGVLESHADPAKTKA